MNCTINCICQFRNEFIYSSRQGTNSMRLRLCLIECEKHCYRLLDCKLKKSMRRKTGKTVNSPERLLLNRIWTIWFVHFPKILSAHSPFVVHASLPARMQTARRENGKVKENTIMMMIKMKTSRKFRLRGLHVILLSMAFANDIVCYTQSYTKHTYFCRRFSLRFKFKQIQFNYRWSILQPHIHCERENVAQRLMLLKWVKHIAYILIDYPLKWIAYK